jgi:hypothetical protein
MGGGNLGPHGDVFATETRGVREIDECGKRKGGGERAEEEEERGGRGKKKDDADRWM